MPFSVSVAVELRKPMITVIIPSIPPRADMLTRALASVKAQTLQPAEVIVEFDHDKEGPAVVRNRALSKVITPWVAFLDDDDEFRPQHLETLLATAEAEKADYVYAWYDVKGGTDPMPGHFGLPWDDADPRQTTITVLVKTRLAREVGFQNKPGRDPNGGNRTVGGEDYRFTLGCLAAGAKIVHVPERTWIWHHHPNNTSGLPSRWR